MKNSKIEWTDSTWNFVLGCEKTSPGCKNCYAIREVHRMASNPNPKIAAACADLTVIQGGKANWTGQFNFVEERLKVPLQTKKPSRYFVNSLSDLFHPGVKEEWIWRGFAVMSMTPHHTFQILTKHPERALKLFEQYQGRSHSHEALHIGTAQVKSGCWIDPLPNVWIGVSVENQAEAEKRIPLLLQIPSEVRFISAEPLLGPLDLTDFGNRLDWVIIGGESGPGARPMDIAWARSIRNQCAAAKVACFVKQLGAEPISQTQDEYFPRWALESGPKGPFYSKFADKKGGDIGEWPIDLRVREYPKPAASYAAGEGTPRQ